MDFDVLYLGPESTQESIDEAHTFYRPEHTHVVYAPSLDNRRRKYHRERFGQSDLFWNSKEYIHSFIHDELDA